MVINYRIILIFLVLALGGCTIKPPEVNITSEKTALERQMFGEKVKVSNEPSSMIAMWSVMDGIKMENRDDTDMLRYKDKFYKRKLMLAQVRRRTMQEFINELKRQGLIGESKEGKLIVMADTISQADQIQRIVDAENQDRKIILEFYFESQGIKEEQERLAVTYEFAQVTVRVSPDSTWIEDYDGNWAKK